MKHLGIELTIDSDRSDRESWSSVSYQIGGRIFNVGLSCFLFLQNHLIFDEISRTYFHNVNKIYVISLARFLLSKTLYINRATSFIGNTCDFDNVNFEVKGPTGRSWSVHQRLGVGNFPQKVKYHKGTNWVYHNKHENWK